tara:strand:- start:680 stop:937 length:258 start_codon:yes stop_codon:yes gene_type:complete
MIERLLGNNRRIEIRDYARERWKARRSPGGNIDAATASLVQEDVFRFIRRKKVGGVWSMLLMQIAMKFAARLINKWLEDLIDEKR